MDRILGIKLKHFAIGVFSVAVLAACSLGDTDTLGNYKKETKTFFAEAQQAEASTNCLSVCAPRGQGSLLAQGNALWYW